MNAAPPQPVAGRERQSVVALVILAALLRLIAIAAFRVPPGGDAAALFLAGETLAQTGTFSLGGGVPETLLPPGVPAVIAVALRVFGTAVVPVSIFQAVLDLLACLALWRFARDRFGPRAALVTLALLAVTLTTIFATRLMRGESMGTSFLMLALFTFDRARSSEKSYRWLLATGVLTALLTLVRWNFSLFPLFLAGFVLIGWRPRPWGERVRAAGILGVGVALVLTPWLLRNHNILGTPTLSTQTGRTFYSAHCRAPGQPWGNNGNDAFTEKAGALPALESSRFLVEKSMECLRKDPLRPVRETPEKAFWFFVPFDWETIRPGGEKVFNAVYFVTAILALLGVGTALKTSRRTALLLLLPLGFLLALCLPFYGSPRFRGPAEPLLTPIAALGALRLLALRKKTR